MITTLLAHIHPIQVAKPPQYKPYAEVITTEAKSQDGVFKVHQVGEKIFFEIPASALGRDMLWQAQEVQIPHPLGSPGPQNNRVVRWVRRDSKVFLTGPDYSIRTKDERLKIGVDALTIPSIMAAFKVETEGPNKSAVIDISDFLISDPKDMQIGTSWNASLDKNRSYVHKVKAFPTNIEMQSMLSFSKPFGETLTGTDASHAPPLGSHASILMHYSFVMLPEYPMEPRYRDPRIGYFGYLFQEVGGPENRAVTREIIHRYRLEKQDPNAAISEPVKPIVFFIAREVPDKWRPYIRKGVTAWRPAFEQAGFRNAIECRDAPDDPDFDIEDARYSVIRWVSTSFENAFGMRFGDPRTGEIVTGQVIFYGNFLSFLQNMYFAQVAALDPAARRLPFSDELMGSLVQYIITHEVGHAVGLEHNMKASHSYSIAQLRDPTYVAEHDIASSIMDYARFNYVAQPDDKMPLSRGLGEYDRFAIEWGYKQVGTKAELDAIAARQNSNPRLRFGNYLHPEDPATIGEDISNDTIAAARLGLANVRRNAGLLVGATVRAGQDNVQLGLAYAALVVQQRQLLDNVIRLVGGVYAEDHRMLNGSPMYAPVPAERQRAAVRFLCGPEGVPPKELLDPAITSRLFASGDVRRAINFQGIVLFSFFSEPRIIRMFDQEASLGAKAYTVREMVQDIERALWGDLTSVGPVSRNQQRHYLITLDQKLNGSNATRTDLQSIARASLKALAKRIDAVVPKARDRMTSIHLADCRRQIEEIIRGTSLYAKLTPPPSAPPARFSASCVGGLRPDDGFGISPEPFWMEQR